MSIKNLCWFLFSFILLIDSVSLEALSPEDEKFIDKYKAPAFIVDSLSEHTNFLMKIHACVKKYGHDGCKRRHHNLVWKFDTLPGYFVKWGIHRLKGMEKISACIQKNNLDLLVVPKKYLYHIPGKSYTLRDENYLVISESQEPTYAFQSLVINREEARQLCVLLKETL